MSDDLKRENGSESDFDDGEFEDNTAHDEGLGSLEEEKESAEEENEAEVSEEAGESSAVKGELEKVIEERDELKSLLQRIQADFDNFRKRSATEKKDIYTYALYDFVCKILPVMDNMERARDSAKKENIPSSYLEGLDMIRKQIDQLLEQHGVAAIDAKGCAFDPHYHDAVMQTCEGDGEPNTVVEELQKGYRMKDRVLRPAMVKVYTGSDSSPEDS